MADKKKNRLTAVEKSQRALKRLKSQGWILDFAILEPNSLDDSLGFDAWVSYKYNGCKQGKFPFQILSRSVQARKHVRRHFGVPHIAINREDNIRNTADRYLLFLFVHRALNEEKSKGLGEGMSLLCPFKCGKTNGD